MFDLLNPSSSLGFIAEPLTREDQAIVSELVRSPHRTLIAAPSEAILQGLFPPLLRAATIVVSHISLLLSVLLTSLSSN